ncbi:CHAT domain-containing tetratricopeptide repeat protein [Sorangium sp. So ce131]|uniref:CHAT domain-containing tetratricopeptide repeat protein n=1 Tax=Sorangium sp. So ce131 TaxID=3133282 RepID=UPI003F5FA00E
MTRRRWRTWLCGALAGLCALLAAPAAAEAQPLWALPPAPGQMSRDDARLDLELDGQVYNLTIEGRYFEALSAATRLLDLRERTLGPEHPYTLYAAVHAAINHRKIADYHRAASLLERALAVLERSDIPRWWLFPQQESLALTYRDMGDFRRSEALYKRIVADATLSSTGAAEGLRGLAALARVQGDLDAAARIYERELARVEQENTKQRSEGTTLDSVELGVALDDLAEVYRLQGNRAAAERHVERAVKILEARKGTPELSLATALIHQALLYQDTGDGARAEALLQRALAIREKELKPTHPDIAEPLVHLAALAWEKKAYGRAEPLYRRALAILQQALGPEHPRVAECLSALEGLALSRGKLREALPMRIAAVAAEDRNLTRLLTSGSEREKRAFVGRLERSTSATISLHTISAPTNGQAAALALTTILRRKARVLDAMTDSVAGLRRKMTAQDRALLDRLARIDAELSARAYRDPAGQPGSLKALADERQSVEAEVSRRSAAFRADQRPVLLEEVQAAIPEDAALIELFVYRPHQPREKPREQLGAPRYVAYVLRRSGAPAFADLGDASAVDAAVGELRRALSSPSGDPSRLARSVDAQIMARVRPLLGPARRLLISPDGALSLLPFGALVDEDQRALIERFTVTYLTSGRDLVRLATPAAPGQEAVVIADPAFDDGAPEPHVGEAPCEGDACLALRAVDRSKLRFLPLAGTAQEAAAIGERLPGARVLTGEGATEEAVKRLAGPRILHIATHGFFLPADAAPRAGAPGGHGLDAVGQAAAAASVAQADNALLRAGLALAGANRRESGSEDGVLTAAEVSGLDLSGTQLVVLSACDTGVGETSHGEGVQGLRRALAIAGAETQVMSLWRVGDQATRHLMVAYYDQLKSGRNRSDALRDAQLSLRGQRETTHPFYWAAFIVSGNGGPLWTATPKPPAVPVAPGARGRGCACDIPGAGGDAASREALALLLAGLAAATRRRRAG